MAESPSSTVSSAESESELMELRLEEVEQQWACPGFCGRAEMAESDRIAAELNGRIRLSQRKEKLMGRSRKASVESECLFVPTRVGSISPSMIDETPTDKMLKRTVAWQASDWARAKSR
mmetsp:Transcript_12075/g.29568  ORF Transcript_12075/g.29568 Transcript_12075/m.29568 type:complete len:119 (+) Transcript_12075:737-1093(+)